MKVLAQGVTSASDVFNIVFVNTLSDLEKNINEFLIFCQQKNLKLETSNFKISKHVEFAGATLSAELVQGEQVVNILPMDGHIDAFKDL